jgi:hypothetical protein
VVALEGLGHGCTGRQGRPVGGEGGNHTHE